MSYLVRELPKARQDKHSIFRWLHERSPAGAIAWLDAYDSLAERLKQDVATFGLAPENADCEFEVRQALSKRAAGACIENFVIEGIATVPATVPQQDQPAWRIDR